MSDHFQVSYIHPRYLGTWALIGVIGAAFFLPRKWALHLGSAVGRVFYRRNAKRREIVRINLQFCFPELNDDEREALVKEHFEFYGRNVVDFGLAWWASSRRLKKWVQFKGIEHLERAHNEQQPVILITPHAVGMDLGGILLSGRYPTVSMMKRAPDALLNWILTRGRKRMGARMILREEGLRPLIRGIRDGCQCYYIPDEDFGPEHSVFAPFFGVPTATLTVVGRLVKLTGASVMPVMTWLDTESGRYTVDIGAPLENFPTGDEVEDARRVNLALEDRVRIAPAQYMWTLRWFKTRPGGGPSPYDHLVDSGKS